MKRSLSWILISLLFVSCGGDDSAGPGNGGNNNNPTDPTPTAVGTPDGTASSGTIGTGGGSIDSDDGLFTLTVPAGALASDTEITVQPITNTAWGGIGKGYRLTPDGLTFAAPVELSFKVAPEDLTGSSHDALDVATQNDAGVWYILKNRSYDDVTGTLTATTTHFTDYSMLEGFQIIPGSASINTTGTVNLSVKYCEQQTTTTGDDDLTALVISCNGSMPPNTVSNWSVNGIPGGNATVGTVVQTAPGKARYTAPVSVPQANPVAVSADFVSTRGNGVLVSNITIGGTWYGTVTVQQGGYKSEADVVWKSIATYQGLETYRPASGTVHYTPETDYGPVCSFVSMNPRDATIPENNSVLFIDWNVSPAKAFGYGTVTQTSTTCFTCDGWTEPDCQTGVLPGWFEADSLAVSPSGDAIYVDYTNYGQQPPVHIIVDFKKGLPPVSFALKR